MVSVLYISGLCDLFFSPPPKLGIAFSILAQIHKAIGLQDTARKEEIKFL